MKKQKVEAVATMLSKYVSYIMANADEEETFIYIEHQIMGSAVQSRMHPFCYCRLGGDPVDACELLTVERTSGDNTPLLSKLAFPSQQ